MPRVTNIATYETPQRSLARVKGDRELLQDIIGLFFEETPALMAALQESMACHDAQAIARAAHSYDRVCLPGYFRQLGVASCGLAGKAGLESGIEPLPRHSSLSSNSSASSSVSF